MKILGSLLVLLLLAGYGGESALADDDDEVKTGAQVKVEPAKADSDDGEKKVGRRKHKVKEEDNVHAPFVKVQQDEDGRVHVRAPFTKVDTDENGHTRVRAPFTKVDQ